MGYRVKYGAEKRTVLVPGVSWIRLRTMVAVTILAFAIAVHAFWPEGAEKLRSVFLPEPATLVETAVPDMVKNLRSGSSISDSLTVFCSQILDAAS